jgi:hypothetical protein
MTSESNHPSQDHSAELLVVGPEADTPTVPLLSDVPSPSDGSDDDRSPAPVSDVDDSAGVATGDAVGDAMGEGSTYAPLAGVRSLPKSGGEPFATRLALVTASSPERQGAVQVQLDRLSLEQALLDVEVANARVMDLTSRLVEANQRAASLREALDTARAQSEANDAQVEAKHEQVAQALAQKETALTAQAALLDAQKLSTAYRWAAKVWNLRNAIRN